MGERRDRSRDSHPAPEEPSTEAARAEAPPTATVEAAVPEPAPAAPAAPMDAATAQAKFASAQQVQQDAQARLRFLQTQAETYLLSEETEDEMLKLELRLRNLAPLVARLQREAAYAQAAVDTAAIKAHHDACIEAKAHCYTEIAQAVAAVHRGFQLLARVHDGQVRPLAHLTRPGSGEPVLPIRSGRELAYSVVTRMPSSSGWLEILFSPTARPLSRGDIESMQDTDPGLTPLSERVIQGYLAGLRGAGPGRTG
jgi:hypothetical protein